MLGTVGKLCCLSGLVIQLFACDRFVANLGTAQAAKPGAALPLKPCPGYGETGKPPLVNGAECGEILVKEDPANPDSPNIRLNILRLPAISSSPKPDPLLLIQGGPGGSSVDMAEAIYLAFNDLRKDRDLVFVDQRGTGKSNPLNCEQLTAAEQLLPEQEQQQKYRNLLMSCAQKYAGHARFYTTPYAVADLHVVSQELGYTKVNLWGGSYGTRVALEYARQFPQEIRSLVLDGLAPVQIALPKYFAEDAAAALATVNQHCINSDKCRELFGNLQEKAKAVVSRLVMAEQNGQPLKVAYEHPKHQQPQTLLLSAKHFSELIFMSLYSRDLTALLPRAIADADKGDYRLVAALSSLAAEQASFTGISEGMRYTVVCNEDAHFISPADVANSQFFLGLNMVKELTEICSFWPKAVLPDNYFAPISTPLPALLLAGGQDPVTPARWAKQVAQQLPQAKLLAAPGGNHIISMEGCLPKLIAQFIASADSNSLDADCVNAIVPLPAVFGANEAKPVAQPESPISSSVGGHDQD